MGYCGIGLMSVRAIALLGVCLIGLIYIELLSECCRPVRLLSSRVTVQSGSCMPRMCSRGSVRPASVSLGYSLDTIMQTSPPSVVKGEFENKKMIWRLNFKN